MDEVKSFDMGVAGSLTMIILTLATTLLAVVIGEGVACSERTFAIILVCISEGVT